MGTLGDPRAVEPLIAVLSDEDPAVRVAAAFALAALGDARAVEPLGMLLGDSSDAEYAHDFVVPALKQVGGPRAMELIASWEQKEAQRAAAAAPGEKVRPYIGAVGEPYCSEQCYAQGGRYAVVERITGKCSFCGKPVARPQAKGASDCAIIPYEGKALLICPDCIAAATKYFGTYHKCCACQKDI